MLQGVLGNPPETRRRLGGVLGNPRRPEAGLRGSSAPQRLGTRKELTVGKSSITPGDQELEGNDGVESSRHVPMIRS